MARLWTHRRVSALLAALIGTTLGVHAHAEPSWNASIGAEGDESGASIADAEIGWSPTDRFGLSFSAGRAGGGNDFDGDLAGASGADIDSTTYFAGMDWRFTRFVGVALAYDVWDDADNYEKRTAHASLYFGNERARIGLLAQSVESETTAELGLLRRTTSIAFDGAGYGAELLLSGERMSAWASYVSYDYDENVNRLLTFLDNPTLARRPRLEALLGSGLTAAGALLDYSAIVGVDFYMRHARIGVSYSSLRDVVSAADSHSLRGEVEWPLTARWSARLVAGMNDSDIESSALFGGARLLYHSR